MPTHAVWKKRQAEMLFDEFVNIEKRKKGLSKNEIPIALCLQGNDVVADAPRRFSGSFKREIVSVQSRQPPSYESHSLQSMDVLAADAGAVAIEEHNEPNEEQIHQAAQCIARLGDEINDEYERFKDAKDTVSKRLNQHKNNLSYEVFSAIISEAISQDRDAATFVFVMQLSAQIMSQFGWSLVGYFKQYITENFQEPAASFIEDQSTEASR